MSAIFFYHPMRRYSSVILFFSAALSLVAAPLHAKSQKVEDQYYFPLSSLSEKSLASNPALHDSLSKWARAVESGDNVEAFNERNRVKGIMNLLGTRNLIRAADLCVAVGRKALAKGDNDAAILAGENATLFAPGYPAAHFFLAKARFHKDSKNIKSIALPVVSGVKAVLMNRIESHRFVSIALKYTVFALALSFLITFVTLFLTHYRTLFSDIAARLPSHPEGKWRVLVGALVVTVPLAVGGLLLFSLALPLFLWPYLKKSGNVVVGLFAIFVISAPYTVDRIAKGITIQTADTYRALYLLSQNTWDYETKAALERERSANPDNDLITFALGLLNKLGRDKQASIAAYDSILTKHPNDVRTIVNKGNVYFAEKEWDNAAAIYKEAIKVNPSSVEAHYNLSLAYTEMFRNKDSDAEYQKARQIDPRKIDSFRALATDDPGKKAVDFPITKKDLRMYEMALDQDTKSVAKGLWSSYLGFFTLEIYQMVTVGFLLALGLIYTFWNKAIAHQTCSSCGATFCPPIRLTSTTPKCNQCVAAQSAKVGVSMAKKDKKRKEIREYKDWRSKIAGGLDRLIPGVGRTFFQDPLHGLVFTFVTSLILVYGAIAFYSGFIMQKTPPDQIVRTHIVFFGSAAAYWIIMNTFLKRDFY